MPPAGRTPEREATALEPLHVLVAEDDASIAEDLAEALRDEGCEVRWVRDGEQALAALEAQPYELVISDVRMPRVGGLELFHTARARDPSLPFVLMTAYGNVHDAVAVLRDHALHYLAKPFDLDELLAIVREVRGRRLARAPRESQRAALEGLLAGESAVMRALRLHVYAVAASDASVMILGESGSGKEVVARAIHALSARADRRFVALNCASIPESLFEAELFGHERGAFTGAFQRREGFVRAADGGTLFLDEVADMPLILQPKLLRVLEERAVRPLGSDADLRVDVRVISATHADLRARVASGAFREDLFYRLRVVDLLVPALRDRREDLPVLVGILLGRLGASPAQTLTPRAWTALQGYPFPGNVRELQHALEHALVLAQGEPIDLGHLPGELQVSALRDADRPPQSDRPLADAMAAFERQYLLRALEQAGGSRTRTAEALGISRKSVWEKLRRHGLA